MSPSAHNKDHGPRASSSEFTRYDQVNKPDYHLAEAADTEDHFDPHFQFKTCDLARFLHGNQTDRDLFAQELGEAMQEIGFTILVNHGIDPALHARADEHVQELFTQTPLEEKLRYRAARHGSVSEGYFPIKETSDIHPDLVEGWVFGRRGFDLPTADFNPSDFWPKPHLEPFFRELVQAGLPLFLPIMQSVLRFLDCDPHSFDDRLARPDFGQRLNYYPPITEADQRTGAGRLLAHEDIDLFTLLPAPAIEGLQVLHKNGKWVRLNAPEGSIVLNTGDYMQRITNDLMPSTTHRVSPPRDTHAARTSIPLAAYLRPDELLEVLPELPGPKYEPISVITFHTRTTAKFYGDDYAVEQP